MKKDFAKLALSFFALAVAGALEELCPRVWGAGFPFLLSCTAWCALRRTPLEGALFALAAGFAEDSLCSLPFATSASFFAATAAFLRAFKPPLACAALAHPLCQLWTWTWLGDRLGGSIAARMLGAVPTGAVALAAAAAVLHWADGKAAIREK